MVTSVTSLLDWQKIREKLTGSIGFVPTMGSLHEGHLSLVKRSIQENDHTIVSIFVNPTQFNDPKDYQHYPKNIEKDFSLLSQFQVDYVLMPLIEEMYPDTHNFIALTTNHPMAEILEGKVRPGHFSGVLTVVMKLFQIARPTRAYFGEKDYQQYVLIKHMVANYFLPIEVIGCPTIREKSSLPFSSRNARLSPEEKNLAEQFDQIVHKNASLESIKKELEKLNIAVEYLEEIHNRRFVAVRIGDIRLIDNWDKCLQ